MVTTNDSIYVMINTRIAIIEQVQNKIFRCLHECEEQIKQVSLREDIGLYNMY